MQSYVGKTLRIQGSEQTARKLVQACLVGERAV